jgi:hypothetical protein
MNGDAAVDQIRILLIIIGKHLLWAVALCWGAGFGLYIYGSSWSSLWAGTGPVFPMVMDGVAGLILFGAYVVPPAIVISLLAIALGRRWQWYLQLPLSWGALVCYGLGLICGFLFSWKTGGPPAF